MASSKEYLHFILEQLSDLNAVSYRSMMGEFILYYRGKIVGGIYDDRQKYFDRMRRKPYNEAVR